jgi:hypothetical protein
MLRVRRAASRLLLLGIIVVAGIAFATPLSGARVTLTPSVREVTVGRIADQLGVKIAAGGENEFVVGANFTGTLTDPEKLAAFGIKGMHSGARVTAVRMAPDRVYVEADELEPPSRASARLRLDGDGNLVQPPKA